VHNVSGKLAKSEVIDGHPNKGVTLVHELIAVKKGCSWKPTDNCTVSVIS